MKKIISLASIILVGIFMSLLTHSQLENAPSLLTPSPKITHPSPSVLPLTTGVLGEKTLETAVVKSVVDGDTIKLTDGRTLRYIGVDTPETVDPRREVGCYGREASNYNKLLTTGKTVYLERDVSDTDRYGRLLRYVYLQSGEMVNEMLVREGYALASAYPPDIAHQETLEDLERQAREKKINLWGSCEISVTPTPDISTFRCDCAKSCNTITTCAEASFQLGTCGCKNLDGNDDGIACNSLCR